MSTNKKVYVINGSGGVGKDTFVKFVAEYCNYRVINISSIDPIKEIAKRIGWEGKKTEKDRKFLSDLKDLLTEYNDLPMQHLREQCLPFLKDELYSSCVAMFMHIREPQEIEKAVKEFGAKAILVTNDKVETIKSNHADSNVFNYGYDFIIDNSGTLEELKEMAMVFCENEVLL